MHLFSKSTGGFYHEAIHGARLIGNGPQVHSLGGLVLVENPDFAMVANPGCKIPGDAVEITDEQYRALLDGQVAGKVISADKKGRPVLIDKVYAPEELWAQVRHQRTGKFAALDWMEKREADRALLGLPPLIQPKALAERRQFLRDITAQADPAKIDWGNDPA